MNREDKTVDSEKTF